MSTARKKPGTEQHKYMLSRSFLAAVLLTSRKWDKMVSEGFWFDMWSEYIDQFFCSKGYYKGYQYALCSSEDWCDIKVYSNVGNYFANNEM